MENNNVEDVQEQWLTVAEAHQLILENGLSRDRKTVGRWARRSVSEPEGRGEVHAQQRDTKSGFEYVIERSSLINKVKQELEFESRKSGGTSEDMSGHVQPPDGGEVSPRAKKSASEERVAELEELTELRERTRKLEEQNSILERENAVNKVLMERIDQDRERANKQLREVFETSSEKSRLIGTLEERIRLGLPQPENGPSRDDTPSMFTKQHESAQNSKDDVK